jgi:hypothetical protein
MTELRFAVREVLPELHGAAPGLLLRLDVTETSGTTVHALVLRAQVRVEPQRRTYDEAEQAGLVDLFGGAERYAETLRPFLWAHASTAAQGFVGSTTVDLPVPVTYDFDVAATKYLHALGAGDVPLSLLLSGTVFARGAAGLEVTPLPWTSEARCDLPVAVWRAALDAHFPGTAWLRVDRDTLAALARVRAERGCTSWDETLTGLLADRLAAR